MTDWMTYAEAAKLLGISAEAVRQRARRLRWPMRREGNHLNDPAQVQIPDAELVRRKPVQSPDHRPVQSPDHVPVQGPDDRAELHERLGRAEGEVEGLRQALRLVEAQATDLRRERDAEREARQLAEGRAEAAQQRAQAAQDKAEGIGAELAAWRQGGPLTRALRAFLRR
jgi:TolA-binding protein